MTTLYHYTNANGLIGIMDERSFWASEYRFLNDSSEFMYGWEVLLKSLVKYDRDIMEIDPASGLLVKDLSSNVSKSNLVGFVASLTTEGDLLSQWRGYNGGKGYAIGINDQWLNTNALSQNFSLFPILYLEDEQYEAAHKAVQFLIDLLKEAGGDGVRAHEAVKDWWKHALKVAFAFKNKNFSEEKEYRLAYISDTWPSHMKLRVGAQGAIPYLQCFFDREQINHASFHPNNLGLEKIIVGPALRSSQAIAVEAVQAKQHMRFEVTLSDIPYVAD